MSKWECSVCGYVHNEEAPPEQCPVCEAPAKMFKEVLEKQPEAVSQPEANESRTAAVKRWRCTVCGYVHTGDEPPEKCPVCDAPKKMFVEIDEDGKALSELETEEAVPAMTSHAGKEQKKSSAFLSKIAALSLKFHLHPITVHFPNGILPAVVAFLALSVYFNIVSLEAAAYYNLIFVLLMLPMVLLTGFIEWQKRYKGVKTMIFIVKIICSLIVLALVNVLVFWRLIDPAVVAEGSPSRLIYLGIAGIMLAVVGLAGHLGGKLVFGARGD
jgi:rubredoxin/uncharacterized membrane protein